MANRDTFPVTSPKSDVQIVTASLKGAGAADMVPQASVNGIKSDVVTAKRTGAGTFSLAFRHEYAELLGIYPLARGATAGMKGRISAVDVGAKTATLHVETFGDGTAAAYQTGITVASDTATLGQAGVVTYVEATTATSAGVKAIQSSGTPAAGHVTVTYTAGVPTLTFAAADGVTVAKVMQLNGAGAAAAADPTSDDYVDLVLVVRNSKLN